MNKLYKHILHAIQHEIIELYMIYINITSRCYPKFAYRYSENINLFDMKYRFSYYVH